MNEQSEIAWKKNWEETKQNFTRWWNREGLVISQWGGVHADHHHEIVEKPPFINRGDEAFYSDVEARAKRNHYSLSRQNFPADIMPVASTLIGPGSLAIHLGSRPEIREESVWYHPTMKDVVEPEKLPPLKFDPDDPWWKIQESTIMKCCELGKGNYLVGCPDLVENIDILAALRDVSTLLVDMIERPDWVLQKVEEINQAYFEIYDLIYELIKTDDDGSVFEAYMLWGPGKTAKLQCDAATMFSPAMFNKFVLPAMTEQCQWLDYSMYHLDGKEEFCHLDALLGIEALDAIEWTPNAGEPLGGDPKWYDLYKRILGAGKSVQVYLVFAHEIVPLLDEIGGQGVYVLGLFKDEAEVESVLKQVEQFR
jgi:hypothetical protein